MLLDLLSQYLGDNECPAVSPAVSRLNKKSKKFLGSSVVKKQATELKTHGEKNDQPTSTAKSHTTRLLPR